MNTVKVEIGKQYRNRRDGKIVTVTNIIIQSDGNETQGLVEYQSPLSADGGYKPAGVDELYRQYADEMISFCERHEAI